MCIIYVIYVYHMCDICVLYMWYMCIIYVIYICINFIFYSIITWDKITNDLHSTSGIVEKHLCVIYENISLNYSEHQTQMIDGIRSETELMSISKIIISQRINSFFIIYYYNHEHRNTWINFNLLILISFCTFPFCLNLLLSTCMVLINAIHYMSSYCNCNID